jgi:hypothetical protein
MQTRSTNADHHHQGNVDRKSARSSPEAELIALARGKGQLLTQHTLMLIQDALELRGVSLEVFVADVRPHFRNNILNPSGFLINRARRFHELSRPAPVRAPSAIASGDGDYRLPCVQGAEICHEGKEHRALPRMLNP